MASPKSKAKPATVQDLDEETKQTVPGTEVSAHNDMRDRRYHSRRPTADTVSDSGRSSHTYVTLASADSAKMMPPVNRKLKDPTSPSAPVDVLPTPTATDVPNSEPTKTSPRPSSPSRRHRRAESKSSKKPSDIAPIARQQPWNCHDCYYPMYPQYPSEYGYYQAYPAIHPDAYPHLGYQYSHHPLAEIPPRDQYTITEPRPPRRGSSGRPRPQSFHSAPVGYDLYNMADPGRSFAYHNPRSPDDPRERRDYFGSILSDHGLSPVKELPVVPQAQHARRPTMSHAYTDYPVHRRYSEYMDHQVFGDDDAPPFGLPSRDSMQPGFGQPVARPSSRSPIRAGRLPYERRYSHEAATHPPLAYRSGRSQSRRRQSSDPNSGLHRVTSRSRRDRSHTDLSPYRTAQRHDQPDVVKAHPQPSRPSSHSRRHSQYIDLVSRDIQKPSRSPGHRYTASESRSTRPLSYHAPDHENAHHSKKDREENVDTKYAEARKYQENVTGLNEQDELAKTVHRSYSNAAEKRPDLLGRGPSVRSTHSCRSHRSHHSARHSVNATSSGASKRSDDVEIQIKVRQGGQTVTKKKIFGPTELSFDFDDVGVLTCRERTHNSSSSRGTSSVFSGFLGRSRRASSTEGNKDGRRRCLFAAPILEEVRHSRRS